MHMPHFGPHGSDCGPYYKSPKGKKVKSRGGRKSFVDMTLGDAVAEMRAEVVKQKKAALAERARPMKAF